MSILLENQLHSSSGPLATFFISLDIQQRGFITMSDLRIMVDRFCASHRLSFVQKKLLFLMISQGLARCSQQKTTCITWKEVIEQAPKLLSFFSSQHDHAQTCHHHAQLRYQEIQRTDSPLTIHDIAHYCSSLLPSLFPNKKLLSLFIADSLSNLCRTTTNQRASVYISQQQWCDTALEIMFELEAST